MTISMYDLTVPVFVRYLHNLDNMLTKAEAFAAERKIKPEVLPMARLAPDMHPLAFQVQSSTDRMKFVLARLTGRDAPAWTDSEVTLADLRTRVATGLAYVQGFSPGDLEGSEGKVLKVRQGGQEIEVPAQSYTIENAIPQIFFHVSMAYAILRHNGVPLGKRDFVG